MEFSAEIKDFAAAMAAAQLEMENAAKNANNPAFRSKYADLAEVLNTCRPVLAKHGIMISQGPGKFVEGTLELTTILVHSSGQWIKDTLIIPVSPKRGSGDGLAYDPQSAGTAITYARRYALAAMVGIAQEDDDGNSSSIPDNPPPKPPKPQPKAPNNPQPALPVEPAPVPEQATAGLVCAGCGNKITAKVQEYSLKRYNKPLCMDCQKQAR